MQMIKFKTISAVQTACAKLTGFRGAPVKTQELATQRTRHGRNIRRLKAVVVGLTVLALWAGALQAGNIYVPNGSFELPATVFADPRNDLWEEAPKPVWYDELANGPWGQLTGVFLNSATNSPDYIDNMDGKQAAFFFALPGVALFQDYLSTYGTNASPAHDFNARFEVGKSYQLTVGVIGGGGGMSNGVTLALSLYYRDGASNRVTVAATTVTNQPANFSNTTHFIDFQVQLPAVKAGDAWAGQHIGVQLLSTVGFDLASGYWDLDNVRLTSVRAPVLLAPARTENQFSFILQSEPGVGFEILTTTNLALPSANWTSLGTLTNITGTAPFVDTTSNSNQRSYQARQLP
jgi:hypothetical protein